MPRIEACSECGTRTSSCHDEEACRLTQAIVGSMCPYCHADPGEPCRSAYGNECPQWHVARVHEAHQLLVVQGTPGKCSELNIERPSKGHLRHHWHKRRREAGLE